MKKSNLFIVFLLNLILFLSCTNVDGTWHGKTNNGQLDFNFILNENDGIISGTGTLNTRAAMNIKGNLHDKDISITFETKNSKLNFTGKIKSEREISGKLNNFQITFRKKDN